MKLLKVSFLVFISIVFVTDTFTLTNYENPNSLYNKGLKKYQEEDLGQAMYYLKKAMILNPNNIKIRQLFYTLRKEIGLPPIFSTDTKTNRFLSIIFSSTTPQNYSLIGGFLFLISSILYSFYKIKYLKIYPFIFILSGFFIFCSLIQYYIFFNTKERVVINKSRLYEEPSTNSKLITTLPAGTEVNIIDHSEDFYLIKTIDGQESWMISNNLPNLFKSP